MPPLVRRPAPGFYLLCTEWLFPPDPLLDTSIRVLASGKPNEPPPRCYSGITALAYRAMARLGVMRAAERFDAEHWKTKLIFVSVQLLYTAATLLLDTLLHRLEHFEKDGRGGRACAQQHGNVALRR